MSEGSTKTQQLAHSAVLAVAGRFAIPSPRTHCWPARCTASKTS